MNQLHQPQLMSRMQLAQGFMERVIFPDLASASPKRGHSRYYAIYVPVKSLRLFNCLVETCKSQLCRLGISQPGFSQILSTLLHVNLFKLITHRCLKYLFPFTCLSNSFVSIPHPATCSQACFSLRQRSLSGDETDTERKEVIFFYAKQKNHFRRPRCCLWLQPL